MIVILDTNFLFALRSKKDKYHERTYEILEDLEKESPLYFTNYQTMNETLTLAIKRSNGNISFVEKYKELFIGVDNFFQVVQITAQDIMKIIDICKSYINSKRLLSFTDASLIYLYQELKADWILSFDGHFDTVLNRKF
jgi:predicted nucleic acid-binding protein